ncbi:MAG: glycosyltransferase family 2 protein [Clostridia bacterium]|nr:glycosyltransferase family 2 protein [Clostridia bacterium]
MKDKLKFSIIIPNYNKGAYVEECLNSIFNQTYKNFEVLVIDDGSTDNSLEEINKFQINKLLKTERKQAGGARNLGLKYATGDYIVFLDSDDYLTSDDVLEKLADFIDDEDIIFLNYTKDKFGVVSESIEQEETIGQKIETTNLGCPTKCFKRTLLDGISFPECKRFEDIAFTLEAVCKSKSYKCFNTSFFTYRKVQNSNFTSTMNEQAIIDMLEEQIKMYRMCMKYPEHKQYLMNRITRDRLPVKIEVLNHFLVTGENEYHKYF